MDDDLSDGPSSPRFDLRSKPIENIIKRTGDDGIVIDKDIKQKPVSKFV